MRLRLIIQRHSLPPVQLLWTVGNVLSPFTPEPAATISQFLEQVNEIIPLESEDWGLEDYVVEVRGFECLHFSELSHILREDDEVRVRPLQTSDLRFRKVSGRHQISADGKHLIDGVAFGRPFLRRTERPPVRIPPRKRRRITYDEGSNEIFDEHASNQQVSVQAALDDFNNISPDEDSGIDDDYSPDEEEIGDLSVELKDLHDDGCNNTGEGHVTVAEVTEVPLNPVGAVAPPRMLTRSRKSGGLGLEGEDMLNLVDENGRPYPGEYNNPLLDLYLYGNDEPQPRPDIHTNKKRRTSNLRGNVKRTTEEFNIEPERLNRRISNTNWKGVRFQDAHLETPVAVRDFQDSDQSNYQDFQPSSDMTPNQYGSDKENSEPRCEPAESSAPQTHKYSATLSASSETESEDEDFSFHLSTASTSSNSDVEQLASHLEPEVEAEAGASETSCSDSDHPSCDVISCDVIKASDASQQGENFDISGIGSLNHSSPSLDDGNIKEMLTVSTSQAPYAGKLVTQRRNQRRRDSTRLKRLKTRGVLAPDATIADYHRMQASGVTAKERSEEQSEKPQEEAGDAHVAFETKREYLLKAIASGGIEVTHDAQRENSSSQDMGHTGMVEETALDDGRKTPIDERTEIPDGLQRKIQTDQTQSSPDNKAAPPKTDTDDLGNISTSVDEVEAPADGVKAAADGITGPGDAEGPSDGMTTPNEIETPPEEISASPLETAAEINETGPHKIGFPKRLRLDISSSKRFVFGSLGVRVPQTKEDEASLTAKWMKDVRPLQVFRPEEASKVSEPSITKPTDSWKDKIVLMAVECCDEGVELSTPPFPFVQRWDPQQKKTYKIGNNSRRGKKRKRNDDQHYIKRPKLSENEDMYDWGASASSNLENSAAGELTGPLLEQQDQRASGTENDKHNNVLIEKLQREPDGSAPASADHRGIQDLPSLPEDISTCLPLTEVITLPGTVIAFKQLDMSEETNWQPKISEYRTAKVDCLLDDGTLRMMLAKRDQSNKEELYDQHSGVRVYSKFEMPGFDDDLEDPGVVEISFSELIEPKLIQATKYQAAMQQSSFQDSDHSPPDIDTVIENNFQPSPAGPKPTDPELPDAMSSEARMAGVNEGVRQEIFDLIKEAGWRSSVRSSNEDDQRSEQSPPPSPNRPPSQDQPISQDGIYRDEEKPNHFPSDQFDGFNSSPPRGRIWEPPNQRSSEGLIAESPQSQHMFEIAETVPVHRNTVPNTPTKNSFGNSDEAVDVKEEDYEEVLEWSEPQSQTEADHQMSSQELSSEKPLSGSVVGPVQPEGPNSKLKSCPPHPTSLHELSSDNEFPTLENVFSQVRSSQARSSQAVSRQARPSFEPRISDDDLTYMAKSSFESTTNKGKDSHKGVSQKSESSSEDNLSGKQTLFKWEASDEGDQTTPRASQWTVHPEIVDLTIPSDAADAPGDSDYIDDGTQLPVGPGWVKKTRATSIRLGSLRPGEGRSMRSRSRSVY